MFKKGGAKENENTQKRNQKDNPEKNDITIFTVYISLSQLILHYLFIITQPIQHVVI